MKLEHPFIQLPLLFDAPALAAEVAALGEAAWMPHPQGFAGNSMLPLLASGGDPADESFGGRMLPTPHLERCPYLGQVIASLDTVVGRTRLMRLSGHAEVKRHADQGYYWADRVRVHVPITTQPTVRFECEDVHTHMAAGECWIFDTWRQHRVLNDDTRTRIHLVVDTVGSDAFWAMVAAGRTHEGRELGGRWAPRHVRPGEGVAPALRTESANLPVVMSPWELADRLRFLLAEAAPDASLDEARALTERFLRSWRHRWAEFGDQPAGWAGFRQMAEDFVQALERRVGRAALRNELMLAGAVSSIVRRIAVSGADARPHYLQARHAEPAPMAAAGGGTLARPVESHPRPAMPPPQLAPAPAATALPAVAAANQPPGRASAFGAWGLPAGLLAGGTPAPGAARVVAASPIAPGPVAPTIPGPRADGTDPVFPRPVFIVSSPRSGSTMLFEALAGAPGVFTIGDESHGLIEGVHGLDPADHGYESNRLDARAATPEVIEALRRRFLAALRDRQRRPPAPGPVRMLEKTPKNSLRIPFLRQVFPEATFLYLYREPRETLASMIEAWGSQRFRTYPKLPGWSGPSWSLLLVPGWRELVGKPLADVVVAQWSTATRLLLDDLGQLPADRVHTIRYDQLLADPQGHLSRLAAQLGLGWDRQVDGGLPLSRYTLTAPRPDKWQRHAGEILPRLESIAPVIARAEAFAAR